MTKRDADILAALLTKLTAHFADPRKMSLIIGRGEGRAIVAAIRERKNAEAETPPQGGTLL